MRKGTDRRTDRRHRCDAIIKWAQFNRAATHYDPPIFCRARVLNFSPGGLYFESEYPLKPGATLIFRLDVSYSGTSDAEGCLCLRTISLAEVKWRQDLLKNGKCYYGVGASYPIAY